MDDTCPYCRMWKHCYPACFIPGIYWENSRVLLELYLLLFRSLKGETLLSPNGNNCTYVNTFIFTPVLGVRDR